MHLEMELLFYHGVLSRYDHKNILIAKILLSFHLHVRISLFIAHSSTKIYYEPFYLSFIRVSVTMKGRN